MLMPPLIARLPPGSVGPVPLLIAPPGVVRDERNASDRREGEHGRERRPARIDRKAPVRLEGVHEVALVAAQRLGLAMRERAHDVEAVRIQVAPAGRGGEAIDLAALLLGHVAENGQLQALVVPARDEVDHAADGVRAVDGRGAVQQDLDAVERRHRDLVQVDHAAVQAVGRDPAAVQQDEGGVGALVAQVRRAGPVVAPGRARHDVRVGGQVVEAVRVGRELHDQLLGRGDAALLQLLARDDLQRGSALLGDTPDVGAGDLDSLARRLLRPHGGGDQGERYGLANQTKSHRYNLPVVGPCGEMQP
jgi:hypothetical protein